MGLETVAPLRGIDGVLASLSGSDQQALRDMLEDEETGHTTIARFVRSQHRMDVSEAAVRRWRQRNSYETCSLAQAVNETPRVPSSTVALGEIDFEKQTATIPRTKPVASEDYRKAVAEATGYPVPEGQDVVLEKLTLQERAGDGTVQYWYKFKFVPKMEELANIQRTSLTEIRERVLAAKPVTIARRGGGEAVLNIADLQIGKTDRRGGTKKTVEGFYHGVEMMKDYLDRHGCARAVLTELGDGAENFQNTPVQPQTNDRQLIEQLDIHTELIAYAVTELAKVTEKLTVVGVPSNHMEVREDGHAVGGVHNDYGLLSLSNVKRIVRYNPDAFGHVRFAWPDDHEVSLTLDINGVPCGFAHGHYARGAGAANNVEKWLLGQFAGNHPLQPAHIVTTAHFHHLRLQNIIGGRWWLQAPTMDRGSSWLERSTGEGSSQNGILAFRIEDGATSWSDLELLRTA